MAIGIRGIRGILGSPGSRENRGRRKTTARGNPDDRPDDAPKQGEVMRASHGVDPLARAEDMRLMDAIVHRDQQALSDFYDRYNNLVFSICMRILGHTADAEEAVIDIFWEIWDKPDRYDKKRGSVLSYLMLLAKSRAIDHQRSRQAHLKLSLDGNDHEDGLSWHGAVPSSAPEPIEDLWLSEQRDQVRASLEQLTPPQRQAVELAFFDGLSHRQIADRLNEPLGTIKTRIRQGIIQMREGIRSIETEDDVNV